jgi:hypothetical protein
MKKQIKPVSSVIYNGPSLIDGQPIVVIGIIASNNTKTGNMLQTHIIRADINPLEASKTGADYSICGDCIHRGLPTDNPDKKTAVGRACYVNLGQGPRQVFERFKRGGYPVIEHEEITRLGAKRMIRLGTYGDPAAVPSNIWELLLKEARGHTGYTHQHTAKQAPDYKHLMYSADTLQDAKKAHSKGYRTFRVVSVRDWQDNGLNTLLSNEILCPASKENNKGVTCIECKLCTGSQSKGKSIAIVAHGATKNNFKG